MTRFLLLLILCPFIAEAQQNDLKPIGSDLLPATYWDGYGMQSTVKVQYTYDGMDIRAKDLGQYIIASGDGDAIREYNIYLNSRQAGGWLIAGGVLTAVIGAPIMLSNRPGSDGKFVTQQPYVCPTGLVCGSTVTGKTVYGGGILGNFPVADTQRRRSYYAGSALFLGGAIIAGIGWGLNLPGKHMRRSVQYYNRVLREKGISWKLQPYSTGSPSGIGLVGRL